MASIEFIRQSDQVVAFIGEFNLLQLQEVIRLNLQFDVVDDHPVNHQTVTMCLDARYLTTSGLEYVVQLEFSDVRELRLPPIGGLWFELDELEITDVSRHGFESIRYRVRDHGQSGTSFDCSDIAFISVSQWFEGELLCLWRE